MYRYAGVMAKNHLIFIVGCRALKVSVLIISIAIITLFLISGCQPLPRRPIFGPSNALKPISYFYPDFLDDMDQDSLKLAIRRNLVYLKKLDPEHVFSYGTISVTCRQVIQTQQRFIELFSTIRTHADIQKILRKEFVVLKARGLDGKGTVLFTGYFEPTYEASLVKNQVFHYPIYRIPEDLVKVDLALFRKKYRGQKLVGRISGQTLIPYYSRDEIDFGHALEGKNLEIAWLKDPVDVLFLQIQGSGRLLLPSGNTIQVGYAACNGHPYRSIGRYMIEKGYIDKEHISMQKIREFLHLHPELIAKIFRTNPSYVFFRMLDEGPLGSIGVPLTPGRSIALDNRLFPEGALGFITSEKPLLDSSGEIKKWVPFSRFVLNQDTGGAIKGPGRADIFWGSGHYAEVAAGHMKHKGKLYILLARTAIKRSSN